MKNMASFRTLQDFCICIAFLINTDQQKHRHTYTNSFTIFKTIVSIWHTHTKNNGKLCIVLYFFSALFCYSREQKKILHHVRDHAQWFALHLPWETQLSKQALSIIVHKTWQIVLDRQSCPSFRSVTLSKPTAQAISNKQAQFLKIQKSTFCMNSNTIYCVKALFTWACPFTEEKTVLFCIYILELLWKKILKSFSIIVCK